MLSCQVLPLAKILAPVDIVMANSAWQSRGVGVHEFSHVVMCDLLSQFDVFDFNKAWSDLILQSANQDANAEAAYIGEGFADFITSQVVGGTNYGIRVDGLRFSGMSYCFPEGNCLDENFGAGLSFVERLGTVARLLHDLFDGDDIGRNFSYNDGSHWALNEDGIAFAQHDLSSILQDEAISVAPSMLTKIFATWSQNYSYYG